MRIRILFLCTSSLLTQASFGRFGHNGTTPNSYEGTDAPNYYNGEKSPMAMATAKAASCAKVIPLRNTNPAPPANIKCAQLTSMILMSAGILKKPINGVAELVKTLKNMGWRVVQSAKAIPGAVAFQNKHEDKNDKYSHVGVVDNSGCIINNQPKKLTNGKVIGEVVATATPGAKGCISRDSSFVAGIHYLVPPAGQFTYTPNVCPRFPNI